MIPRTIHYTWFSDDPYPRKIADCMATWHTLLEGYNLVHWDMAMARSIDSPFLHEALDEKKWAFASDFVRLYALYHHGGIYVDTDVRLFKNFDSFLDAKAFIGKENSIHFEGSSQEMYLSSHCFGAEAGNEFVGRCLEYFDGRHFRLSGHRHLPDSLRLNQVLLPYVQSEIAKQMGYNPSPLDQSVQRLQELTVWPTNYFDPIEPEPSSVAQHMALGSWRGDSYSKDDPLQWSMKTRLVKGARKMVRDMLRRNDILLIKLK